MEEEIISRQNIAYQGIPAAGLHGVDWKTMPGNLVKLFKGYLKAGRILKEFKPDVLFFTGGYLAVPVALAGRSKSSLVFIPDIEPGLAIKAISKLVSQIALTVEQSRQFTPAGKEVIVSGYPVRSTQQAWTREQALKHLDLSPDRPILLVFGGSKGARSINHALTLILPDLLKELQVVHITGNSDWEEMKTKWSHLPGGLKKNYRVFPFLHKDMGAALRSADLVISRSGASILGEYPLFELPAILIPYPYAWRYQKTNAKYLVDRKAALMIQDEDLNEKLLPEVLSLIHDGERLNQMKAALREMARPGAAKMIANKLLALAGNTAGGPQE
jgi:UDP-N-acetylglucosamine--N-acetylmuramyl-(pentapeptide) pyrophosphoryl-undecaprenol N-acetylglucosamine transferase